MRNLRTIFHQSLTPAKGEHNSHRKKRKRESEARDKYLDSRNRNAPISSDRERGELGTLLSDGHNTLKEGRKEEGKEKKEGDGLRTQYQEETKERKKKTKETTEKGQQTSSP
jgi:hypothetical protein